MTPSSRRDGEAAAEARHAECVGVLTLTPEEARNDSPRTF
jgi:hypothetical protein